MNDPEDFLTRWSRRKRAAADESEKSESEKPPREQGEQRASDTPPADQPADAATSQPTTTPSKTTEPVFDLSKLPPIESITAETDIHAFLAPGVPAELRLAALRRAWVADPKVRDFVGLNDYDFDFHTPGAIPGFGSLEMTDDLRRELARVITGWQPEPEAGTPTAAAAAEPGSSSQQATVAVTEIAQGEDRAENTAVESTGAGLEQPRQVQDELTPDQATTRRNKVSAASQQEHSPSENLQTLAGRGHGRALPR
jgi:Protein of unknown function (DUF3306)